MDGNRPSPRKSLLKPRVLSGTAPRIPSIRLHSFSPRAHPSTTSDASPTASPSSTLHSFYSLPSALASSPILMLSPRHQQSSPVLPSQRTAESTGSSRSSSSSNAIALSPFPTNSVPRVVHRTPVESSQSSVECHAAQRAKHTPAKHAPAQPYVSMVHEKQQHTESALLQMPGISSPLTTPFAFAPKAWPAHKKGISRYASTSHLPQPLSIPWRTKRNSTLTPAKNSGSGARAHIDANACKAQMQSAHSHTVARTSAKNTARDRDPSSSSRRHPHDTSQLPLSPTSRRRFLTKSHVHPPSPHNKHPSSPTEVSLRRPILYDRTALSASFNNSPTNGRRRLLSVQRPVQMRPLTGPPRRESTNAHLPMANAALPKTFGTSPLAAFGARSERRTPQNYKFAPPIKSPSTTVGSNSGEESFAVENRSRGAGFHYRRGVCWPLVLTTRLCVLAFRWFVPDPGEESSSVPSSIIANERTFVKWNKSALFVCFVARAMPFGAQVLPWVALVVLLGSLRNYFHRRSALYNGVPMDMMSYGSIWLPVVFTLAIVVGLLPIHSPQPVILRL